MVVEVCSMHVGQQPRRTGLRATIIVRGTATELDAADLRPGLTVAAADGVIRSAR